MTALLTPTLTSPALDLDYAHEAGDSVYPGLWAALVGAWAPPLGGGWDAARLVDLSGQANHGTLTNGVTWALSDAARSPGLVLDLDDASSQYVLLDRAVSLPGDFSAVGWVYPRELSASNRDSPWIGRSDGDSYLAFEVDSGRLRLDGNATNFSFAAPFFTTNAWQQAAFVRRNNVGSWYRNAHLKEAKTGTLTGDPLLNVWGQQAQHFGPQYFDCRLGPQYLYRRPLTLAELRLLLYDPLAPFRWRRRVWSVPAAGAPISASLTEGAVFGDTASAIATLAAILTEGALAGESWAVTLLAQAGLTEGTVLGDTLSAQRRVAAALSEGIAAGDTLAVQATLQAILSEGARLGDTLTPIVRALGQVTEGMQAGDTQSALATLQAALAEGMQAGDTFSATLAGALQAAITDGLAAGETWAVTLHAQAGLTEGAVVGDTASVLATLQAALSEGALSGETFAALLQATVRVAEGATLGDTFAATLLGALTGAMAEGTQAGEAFVATLAAITALSEGVQAGDTLTAGVRTLATFLDGLHGGDAFVAGVRRAVALTDGAVAGDTLSPTARLTAVWTEGIALGDVWQAFLQARATWADGAVFGDTFTGTGVAVVGGLVLAAIQISRAVSGDVTTQRAVSGDVRINQERG